MSNKKNKKGSKITDFTMDAVEEALRQENSLKALDMAKILYKLNPGLETEGLLARAYRARIQKLTQSGLVKEALNLIEVAKAKCLHYLELFANIKQGTYHFPLTREEAVRVAKSLHSPGSEEDPARLKEILKTGLSHIDYLADSLELPSDSVLKREASLIKQAFAAVTDSVSEEKRIQALQELSSVPRHSPLSDWLWLIRSLDAFYREDDKLALEILNRIPEGIALSPAKTLLKSLIAKSPKPEGLSSHSTRELWKSLRSESTQATWQEILQSIESRRFKILNEKIHILFESSLVSTPFAAREYVRSIIRHMIEWDAYNPTTLKLLKDKLTRFWGKKASMYIDIFVSDAFGFDLLKDSDYSGSDFSDEVDVLLGAYGSLLTKKEKAALMARAAQFASRDNPNSNPFSRLFYRESRRDYSESIRLYQDAIKLHPLSEYYSALVPLMEKEKKYHSQIEPVLEEWHKAYPEDAAPLVHLFEWAERRNALQKAETHLQRAEQVDPTNPKVRTARRRLVWQMIQKHLKQNKPHLVEKDLERIRMEELPPAFQSLFTGVLRLVVLQKEKVDPGPGDVNPIFSALLLDHLDRHLQLKLYKSMDQTALAEELDTSKKLEVYYDLCDVFTALGEPLVVQRSWLERVPEWIAKAEPISDDLLVRIAQTIVKVDRPKEVIAATQRALPRNEARLPELLFYRAIALEKTQHYQRVEKCFQASLALARARGHYELARQIQERLKWMRPDFISPIFPEKNKSSEEAVLSPSEVAKIVEYEKQNNPLKPKAAPRPVLKKKTQKSAKSQPKKSKESSAPNEVQAEEPVSKEPAPNPEQELLF